MRALAGPRCIYAEFNFYIRIYQMIKHYNLKIYGLVQEVFFRESARNLAKRLGLTGWTKNELDGTVKIEIEGEEKSMKEFMAWCKKGPPGAEVKKVEVKEGQVKGYADFLIII